ncbi:enoyl-CoA hydratase/isomerase family protein [Gordonia aurantiaca]|uniref:enoyl-CoA hydratase/isomerase family protein n=1 Tax=Gordonia sp. B21 TaxID=3151852 RepID=UPI003264607B
MHVRRISIADLAAEPLIGGGDLLGVEAEVTRPITLVDLDVPVPVDVLDRAVARARTSDVILAGVASGPLATELHHLVEALDLTFAPVADHRAVVGAADLDTDLDALVRGFVDAGVRCPQASLVAAQVVRTAAPLEPVAAIDVESLGYSTLQGGIEYGRWLEERRALGRPLPPAADVDPVLLERDGTTLHITLNRPERRNAYGTALRDALVEALRIAVLDDSIEHVVIDGAGSSFCAGGDLDEFGHMPDSTTAHLIRTRGGAGRLVATLADRIEVRLHGHCVGAGIEIPAFAGRIVAAPDTRIRLPEVSMGLIPGAGGTASVSRRIGRWRALYLFVTGAEIGAEQALRWGLVDEVVG